jgi:hypothetical protein
MDKGSESGGEGPGADRVDDPDTGSPDRGLPTGNVVLRLTRPQVLVSALGLSQAAALALTVQFGIAYFSNPGLGQRLRIFITAGAIVYGVASVVGFGIIDVLLRRLAVELSPAGFTIGSHLARWSEVNDISAHSGRWPSVAVNMQAKWKKRGAEHLWLYELPPPGRPFRLRVPRRGYFVRNPRYDEEVELLLAYWEAYQQPPLETLPPPPGLASLPPPPFAARPPDT